MTDEPNDKPINGLEPFRPGATILSRVAPRQCSECEFCVREDKDLVFRFMPPQVGFIPVPVMQPGLPGRAPQQGISITAMTQFPVVKGNQWCGQFEKKVAR